MHPHITFRGEDECEKVKMGYYLQFFFHLQQASKMILAVIMRQFFLKLYVSIQIECKRNILFHFSAYKKGRVHKICKGWSISTFTFNLTKVLSVLIWKSLYENDLFYISFYLDIMKRSVTFGKERVDFSLLKYCLQAKIYNFSAQIWKNLEQ